MMNQNQELIKKVKAAKSPEELKSLAKENNMELTEEEAGAYYAQFHGKNGELSDDELDNVAGGGCHTDDGRLVVSALNLCSVWRCNHDGGECRKDGINSFCYVCNKLAYCNSCKFCSYENGLWLCNNPVRRK